MPSRTKKIKDFMGIPMEVFKCSRCRKPHTRLGWDKNSTLTCPRCTNQKELSNEDSNL